MNNVYKKYIRWFLKKYMTCLILFEKKLREYSNHQVDDCRCKFLKANGRIVPALSKLTVTKPHVSNTYTLGPGPRDPENPILVTLIFSSLTTLFFPSTCFSKT